MWWQLVIIIFPAFLLFYDFPAREKPKPPPEPVTIEVVKEPPESPSPQESVLQERLRKFTAAEKPRPPLSDCPRCPATFYELDRRSRPIPPAVLRSVCAPFARRMVYLTNTEVTAGANIRATPTKKKTS